ncbi:MAG: hypothetical protein HQK54_10275, partial [Oligoflexales bacterium]|nr:hypothetical protein [Oligoflexales bacterium]
MEFATFLKGAIADQLQALPLSGPFQQICRLTGVDQLINRFSDRYVDLNRIMSLAVLNLRWVDKIKNSFLRLIAGHLPTQRSRILPRHFNLASIDKIKPPAVKDRPDPISPHVAIGWPANPDQSNEVRRNNLVMCEIIERLAENSEESRPERGFTMTYNGKFYCQLADFLTALENNHHEITCDVRHVAVNFLGLWGTLEDGKMRPVAAPVMIRTGFK